MSKITSYLESLERIIRIHKMIQLEATGNPDEFACKLGVTKRHMYNILEEFKDYGADIKYRRENSSFCYENDFEISIKIKIGKMCNL